MSDQHHVRRVERGRRAVSYIAPFVAFAVLGLSSLIVPTYRLHGPEAWLLVAAFVLTLTAIVLVARQPEHSWLDPVPAFLFLVVVALARDLADGKTSALNPLVALPIVWLALAGNLRQIYAIAAATAAVFVVPMVVAGPPQYPESDWQAALVWSTFAALIAPVLHRVVGQLASETQRARRAHGEIEGIMRGARMTSLISCEVDGTIRSFSQGAEALLGYRAEDVVGKAHPGIFHDPEEIAEVAAELGVEPGFEVFTELARRAAPSRTWTYVRSDGGRLHVRLALTELYDDGVLTGYLGVGIDTSAAVAARRALALSEAQWRVLLQHLPQTVVVMVDESLQIQVVAGAGVTGLGLTLAEGDYLWDVVRPENRPVLEPLLKDAFNGGEGTVELMPGPNGSELRVFVTDLPADADVRRAMILTQDVSAEREYERAVLRAKQRAERLFADAPHGVAVLTTDGVVVQANAALGTILGLAPADLEGRSLSSFSTPGDDAIDRFLTELLDTGPGSTDIDCTVRNAWDHDVHVGLTGRMLRGEEGAEDVALVNVVDVSERRRYQERLAHLADHDVLTGLANRRLFDMELERHVDHCQRYGPSGALLLLDLDFFKQVNDTLGHGAGDQLLISTAGLLRKGIRSTDVVARLGGDEFAVLLTEGDLHSARTVAESIVSGIRAYTSTLDGIRRRITASVGVVTFQAAVGHEADVLALADMTMYDAKDAGRDRFVVLDEDITRPPRSGARLRWQSRIEDSLADDGFALHLQPIMDLRTDTISSAEVLLRMRDGDQLLAPSHFLYVAERSGLINEIDEWVVRNSIEMLARLRRLEPDFRLEVNLSGLLHRCPPDRAGHRGGTLRARRGSRCPDPGDHRDRGRGRCRGGTRVRRTDDGAGLQVRARRLRGGVRVVLLPQAPALRLREDRWGVRRQLSSLPGRPDDPALDRRHRSRPGQADRRGVRLRTRDPRGRPCRAGRLRPGLPDRRATVGVRVRRSLPGCTGQGRACPGRPATVGSRNHLPSGGDMGKFSRAVGILILGSAVLGAALLWAAVALSSPAAGRSPSTGLFLGVWKVVYDTEAPSLRVMLAALGLALLFAAAVALLERRITDRARRSSDEAVTPLAPGVVMAATQGQYAGPVTVTVLIPAHNEADCISATLTSLISQSHSPERIVVVADNCTDDTVGIAQRMGVDVIESQDNAFKKAGALNQALARVLPGQGDNDLVMVMDADTTLDAGFLEAAVRRMTDDRGLMAIGGLFYGEQGAGLIGQFQRNEYIRYAREMRRRRGRVFVLTGTASIFRPVALRTVAAERGRSLPGVPGDVYDTVVLTEDNELTLALKSLGALLISPGECTVVTEVMPTWQALWSQRLRWQRGALENLGSVRRAPGDVPLLGPAARDRVRRDRAERLPPGHRADGAAWAAGCGSRSGSVWGCCSPWSASSPCGAEAGGPGCSGPRCSRAVLRHVPELRVRQGHRRHHARPTGPMDAPEPLDLDGSDPVTLPLPWSASVWGDPPPVGPAALPGVRRALGVRGDQHPDLCRADRGPPAPQGLRGRLVLPPRHRGERAASIRTPPPASPERRPWGSGGSPGGSQPSQRDHHGVPESSSAVTRAVSASTASTTVSSIRPSWCSPCRSSTSFHSRRPSGWTIRSIP